ncbi:MAG: hypothetical protein V4721_04160 [Bacteroidota bacterium]
MKKFLPVVFIVCFLIGCKKETETKKEEIVKIPTQAMFWIETDLGCGVITVTCNGVSKDITGYFASEPSCGSAKSATFDLVAGNHNYTAKCSGKTWTGTITVKDGQCNAFKLISSASDGSGGSGGSTGGGTTGGGSTTNPGSTNKATITLPSTQFVASQDYSVTAGGSYWTQEITVSGTTVFDFRFASQYGAQAAIIVPAQLTNFQTNKVFTGFGLFDNKVGTQSVTLTAGKYYVAVRNTNNGPNKWSLELDKEIVLPASDRARFVDVYASGAKSLTAGSRVTQAFTVQAGYRYFLDGVNVNCDVRIIPSNQLSAFQNGQKYEYYTDYGGSSGAEPGLYEIELTAGTYYIVSYNTAVGALTYSLERWKVD